jgi:hypothetical protein
MHGERGFNGGGRVRVPIYGGYFFSLARLSLTISVIYSLFFHAIVSFNEPATQNAFV